MTLTTGNRYLLDTVIVISLLNHEEGLASRLIGNTSYINATVLGELLFGTQHSGRASENVNHVRSLTAGYTILPCDSEPAETYASIR